MGFPDSSVGKESTHNARDPGSVLGLGSSTGEGIGYPLQFSWTSLGAQLVKNPPAMWETWVRSLGWEDSLEKGRATHSSILAWRIPWTVQSMGSHRVEHNERLLLSFTSTSRSRKRGKTIMLLLNVSLFIGVCSFAMTFKMFQSCFCGCCFLLSSFR